MKIEDFNVAVSVIEEILLNFSLSTVVIGSSNAPETFEDLKRLHSMINNPDNPRRVIVVNDQQTKDLIWTHPSYNLLFRAYHDLGHIDHGLSFKFDDERILGRIQANELMQKTLARGYSNKIALNVYNIIMIEICAQIDYYQAHNRYVENQRQFMFEKLGIREAA